MDIAAAVLLAVALLLPWNLSFGVGVPDGSTVLFVPLIAATLSSWVALAAGRIGRRGKRSASPPNRGTARIRLALTMPYLLLVAGFVVFTYAQVVQFGGTGDVPAGIGPGLLVGLAGALLAAQPPLGSRYDRWFGAVRAIGVIAAASATVAVLANLYWRNRFPVEALLAGTYTGPNIAVVATTVVYGAVAWVAVLVGLRWLVTDRQSARLAMVALGGGTVLGTVLTWLLGVGRDIDAFHGISQTTSTAAVGFEGYVAWVAAAAIVGPWTLRVASTALPAIDDWKEAMRKCLGIIAFWCAGSALLRVFDLIVAASLDMPYSPYDSVALLAFDIVAAAAAIWIRFNINGTALHPAVLSAAAGVLFVLTVCRVVVGVGLAPRILYTAAPEGLDDAVYGNTLAQQITSTFDVVLCWLALAVAAISVVVLQRGGLARQVRGPIEAMSTVVPTAEPSTRQLTPVCATTGTPTIAAPATTVPAAAVPVLAAPKIARTPESATQKVGAGAERMPRITRVLEESTNRFAAGTTYTGTGSARPPSQP
ncbi:hypothetical protein JNN96_32990 [Mycobacterium sp. DSM 3803]|nr:hypothetical protein [Mycobacterium sp. DSM 3803]